MNAIINSLAVQMRRPGQTIRVDAQRRCSHLTLLLIALVVSISIPIATQAGPRHEQYAAGHILIKPRTGITDAQLANIVARHGARGHRRLNAVMLNQVDVTPGAEETVVQAMALDPEVEFAEVDRRVYPEATTANDTYYGNAWHLAKIGAPAAWDIAKGDGVVVAVLDSGVDSTHPDLAGQLVPGWNLYDNNSDTADVYGHGTEVAGVIAAASNNSLGVTSLAWHAKVMPIRVSLPDGSAYVSSIANGITYAADHGASIANASFSYLTGSQTIQSAANYMRGKGGLVVVAAGNAGALDSTPNTAAVISVSATGSNDALADWSSYGPYVDVSAPGSGIWTTTKGGGYASVSGTSFSAPMVSALLALMKSSNPTLGNAQLESILESSAVDLGTPGYDQYYGAGRIDAAAAVAAAAAASFAMPTPDTQAPHVSVDSPSAGATVSSTVTVVVSAIDNVSVSRVELYAGSTLIGTGTAAPYSFTWDTTGTADGTTALVAYAYDTAGNKGASGSVAIQVANAPSVSPPGANAQTSVNSGSGSSGSNVGAGGGGGSGGGGSADLLSLLALAAARRVTRINNQVTRGK